jgi:hypothetical protein
LILPLLLMALGGLGLPASAPEIVRRPTQLTSLPDQPGGTIEIVENASIRVGPGSQRVIRRGSTWVRVGRSAEGELKDLSFIAEPLK